MKIVDMHCDTISALYCRKESGLEGWLFQNSGHLDLEKMKKSGYLLQNFALFVDQKHYPDSWQREQEYYQLFCREMEANRNRIRQVRSYADIEDNQKAGLMSALLTVEDGGVCQGDPEKLQRLHEQGVCMITLTWNYPNELGYPNLGGHCETGLTETGREFVSRMEKLGIIVDVSHLSDAGFYDVLAGSSKPFVASHSNARAVCPHARNMTDDMIRRLAERGGVMGLNFSVDFLEQRPEGEENPGTVAAVVRHARHIVNVGGMECLGLGSDFDGIATHQELPHAGCMDRLFDALKRADFTEDQIEKIFAGNVLRLYREVLG